MKSCGACVKKSAKGDSLVAGKSFGIISENVLEFEVNLECPQATADDIVSCMASRYCRGRVGCNAMMINT